MNSKQLREIFLKFFQKNGHKILPPSSLVPENDPTVLFTTAGMQQFKDYYIHPQKAPAQNIATCQPCVRTSDIELVGDDSHLTFFEMLGNFSFGGYFKEVAIKYAYEFLTKDLAISHERISVGVFAGDKDIPLDQESESYWKLLKIPEGKIKKLGRDELFWGPTGAQGPCGPTSEIYVDKVEVWNLVFNEYYYKDGKLSPLQTPGVDTGVGFERLLAVLNAPPAGGQGKKTVYETDLFENLKLKVQNLKEGAEDERKIRIICDHIRAITFLLAEGILPSNKAQGYVLRRLIRRAKVFGQLLGVEGIFLPQLAQIVVDEMGEVYPLLAKNKDEIEKNLKEEEERFEKTLATGLKELERRIKDNELSGKDAFVLYDTFGFPLELTQELAGQKGVKIETDEFEKLMGEQKERARASAEIFTKREANPRLHTAAHLLHKTLQEVLGPNALQRGQDITGEVLRFDFSHPSKLSEEELGKIEKIVQEKIAANLPVQTIETTLQEAKKLGATALFYQKYGDKVTLYYIGRDLESAFSKELCGGPHAKNTSEIDQFKIISEKSAGSGIRRIKAKVD